MNPVPDNDTRSRPHRAWWWLTALVLGVGVLDAYRLRWTCDDAYISFRYARNWVRGEGLVFNIGEAVEGYTNFLWTIWTALGLVLHFEPDVWTSFWGIVCWLAVGLLLGGEAWRNGRWPVAALAWAAFPYGRMFATSGLETSAFTMLLLATVLAVGQKVGARLPLLWGLLASATVLTRPEGGLAVLLVLAVAARAGIGALLSSAGVMALVLVPWLVFKTSTYGALLPNTWVAKAGAGPRWGDGFAYLALFAAWNPVLAVGVLGWGTPRARRAGGMGVLLLVAVYLAHIARSGGDFMYARFCVPLVPFAVLGLEHALQHLRERARIGEPRHIRWLQFAAVAMVVGVALAPAPASIFGDLDSDNVGQNGVVDERSWYPPAAVELARRQGAVLSSCLAKSDVRVVYYGTQAMLMYYGDLPYALEPHVGLTDAEVARLPPPEGQRIGHGQKADTDYLRARSIDLAFSYRLQLPTTEITAFSLPGGVEGRILTYRRPVMAQVKACGGSFLDFEAFLDQWISNMDQVDDETVAKAYTSFSSYYFAHNDDPARESAFLLRLGRLPTP